jgi:RHS repeat-associated protein
LALGAPSAQRRTCAPTFGARAQVDRPLAVVDGVGTLSPQLYFVHADHLHRPLMMTDVSKASVWSATWQPWGGVHAITGTATLSARFPGQWFQLEAGLHYNWHRHYDPTLGRYTQPDPLGFVDGPSVYAYFRGIPTRNADVNGRQVAFPPPWRVPPAIFCAVYRRNAANWHRVAGSYSVD